jgi:hypothetical protein
MRKLWVLSLKEICSPCATWGAGMMLATPLAITLVMAAAFGTARRRPVGIHPVLLLNQDGA